MSAALVLLPDFLLIALGAILRRLRWFDGNFWSGVERLVYFVLFPALLFRSLALSPSSLHDASRLALVGVAFTLAGMLLSALAQPLFHLPRATFAACFQCGFRFNTYVALAAASRLGGAEGVALMSMLTGILGPIVNVAAVAVLARAMGRSLLERQMAVVMAAVPTATSAYILAVQMKGAGSPVAMLISFGTLLAAVTLPLWIAAIT